MATVDESRQGMAALRDALDRYGLDWVHLALANVVFVALVARLYDLGGRVAHWDEGRVAYWTIRYMETGDFQYRPIIHGPFYHHVNQHLFGVFGATDVSMRLVVAVVGGLFPLVALLFRHRLRDVEVVALALVFAVNPVLLYYSRFMRGDPLVAMFMFAAFALFLRALDTRNAASFHAGVIFTAFGFTVKENALLYLVSWVGAAALVLDYRLLSRDEDRSSSAIVWGYAGRAWRLLWRHWLTVVLAVVEFLAIVVYFYAPRRPSEAGPGLWTMFTEPTAAPEVLWLATGGAFMDLWGLWVAGDHQSHPYLPYLGDFLQTMGHGALALSLLAILGFVVDRYSRDGPSELVSFCFYWGFASVLGYPLVTDIQAPWATVNAVVPLAVPAAVGLGLLGRWTYRSTRDADSITAGLGTLALILVVGSMVATSAGAVYLNPQSSENELVQYAQPADDLGPVTDRLATVAGENDSGPDVVLYGEYLVDGGSPAVPRKPGCAKWFNALPLPWYFAASDADVTCAENASEFESVVSESEPPMVIVRESQTGLIEQSLTDYEARTYRLRAWGTETTFYVRSDYASDLPPADDRGRTRRVGAVA